MEYIDTHCHLFLSEFEQDRDEAIQRALKSGVSKFLLPNVDSSTMEDLLSLTRQYSRYCYPMAGLHPSSVEEDFEDELSFLKDQFKVNRFYGVGEIGLDVYCDKTFMEEQITAFKEQLGWAIDMDLPAIIHIRNSFDEVFKAIEDVHQSGLRGIFHCFTGTVHQANRAIELGFSLGIGGILTFKNAGLDRTLQDIDLKHLVLETDSPYLSPVPKRGKRNEPAFLPYIAKKLAEIKNLDVHQIAEETSKNAVKIFGI